MVKKFNKYVIEGSLIIFSVLFALFLNKSFDAYQLMKQKRVALQSIQMEIQQNKTVLEEWNVNHKKIKLRIDTIAGDKNSPVYKELSKGAFFNFSLLHDNSLVQTMLSSTAWETAQSTGILSEVEFRTLQDLTQVYAFQRLIMNKSLDNVIDLYFDRTTQDIKTVDATLRQFQLRFNELIGQENVLLLSYQRMLDKLED